MAAAASPIGPIVAPGSLPTRAQAQALAADLLGSEGTRLAHVRTAGSVAARLAPLFGRDVAHLLEVAATLHDVGYSARIRSSGFHPLDGGAFLEAEGYPPLLVRLVANHSLARMTAGPHLDELLHRFPPVPGLLSDALAYADMHSAPDGRFIRAEERLADIASRHPGPPQAERAIALRLSLTRVGAALLRADAQLDLRS